MGEPFQNGWQAVPLWFIQQFKIVGTDIDFSPLLGIGRRDTIDFPWHSEH